MRFTHSFCTFKKYVLNTSNRTLKYFLLVLFLSLTHVLKSQTLYPEITNYSFGSSQNWSVDIKKDKPLYVANNSGLSTYNGQFWSMYKLPKNMIIRSVFYDNDVIYTGSYEEFGFWKKNELGELKYHSLKSKFENNNPSQSEEFWQIVKFRDQIIFRSFGAVYSYNGETIKKVAEVSNISSLCVYKDKLLIGSLDNGLLEIIDSEVKPYIINKELKKNNTVSKLSSFENLLFIHNQNSFSYLIEDSKVSKLPTSINTILKNYTLNKVTFIDKNNIAFGTVKNGVIIYTIDNQQFKIINKQSGLRNNTVLDIKAHKNNLWLALDDGVSKIDIKSAYSYFNDATGVLGTVYDVSYFNDKYYLASNTGVYTFKDDELTLVKNSEGHCWGMLKYQNQLFFGHNRGAFVLENDKLIPIKGSFSGVYNYLPIPKSQNLLVSTYSGIGVLKIRNNTFSITKLTGLDMPVDKLIFENDTTLWATDNYKGLFKINFDYANIEVKEVLRLSENPIINENKVELQTINNELYFIIDDNWFTYSNKTQTFEPFLDFLNKHLLGVDNQGFWIFDKATSSIINYSEEFQIQKTLTNKNLVSKFVDGYERIIFKNDSLRIFNLKDGFSVLNLENITTNKTAKPIINKVYANDKLLNISNKKLIELNHKQSRSISFDVYTPGSYDNELQYELQGETKQSEEISEGNFTLQNLPAGDYILNIFEKGNPSTSKQLKLIILPPWYLSVTMKIVYLLMLIAVIYITGKYQKNKAEKAHLKTQQRLLEEAKQKIELVEKNNLINEVKTKKKELTNRTATIVQKNEAIILLRNELKRLQKNSSNATRTKYILQRSGEQLDSKNDWKLFESKFNELNEDFFKGLSKEFPKLTTKDRKLCAYIKIGLISKEIAPLMGITIRSVELQRYRLRKKLNLGTEITFIEFLSRF